MCDSSELRLLVRRAIADCSAFSFAGQLEPDALWGC
jgi:hypothetical protein